MTKQNTCRPAGFAPPFPGTGERLIGDFGDTSVNELNIHPESLPDWVAEWLPDDAGYLMGNLGPGCMNFRFFS